jgi:hypothetical protein
MIADIYSLLRIMEQIKKFQMLKINTFLLMGSGNFSLILAFRAGKKN